MAEDLTSEDWERYQRHLSLPEISPSHQIHLQNTHLVMVGAGGLGCAALPHLAGAGIGKITIIDHDEITISNLHRQTIFKTALAGENKAQQAAAFIQALNPNIRVAIATEKLEDVRECPDCDILLDGSDNFETKILLNRISIEKKIPLISASVNQFQGQAGIFAGYAANAPCYNCLFPQLPYDARNCNEAGVIGTAAGLTGLYQAHLALGFLIGLDGFEPGLMMNFDFKHLRISKISVPKQKNCPACKNGKDVWNIRKKDRRAEISLMHPKNLRKMNAQIIDVRTNQEVSLAPLPAALHIPLDQISERFSELPEDKRLAFACSSNVRSRQAAELVQAMGRDDICIYDVLAD